MKCPVCTNVNLVMSERQGIEIEYCPECRGVWLDRGELDKIIESSGTQQTIVTQATQPIHRPGHHNQQVQKGHGYYNNGYGHDYTPYKKKSFLEELFD